jgi:hypothetical protein
MQQTQPSVVAQNLEESDHIGRLLWRNEWPFRKRRLARRPSRSNRCTPIGLGHYSTITRDRVLME